MTDWTAETAHENAQKMREWAYRNITLGEIISVKVVEVIQVEHRTGLGISGSPAEIVTEWFRCDGTRIGALGPGGEQR